MCTNMLVDTPVTTPATASTPLASVQTKEQNKPMKFGAKVVLGLVHEPQTFECIIVIVFFIDNIGNAYVTYISENYLDFMGLLTGGVQTAAEPSCSCKR